MKTTIRHLLAAASLLVSGGVTGEALAEGPADYGYDTADPNAGYNQPDPNAGYNQPDPNAGYNPDGSQVYQPPPEGVCFDDNNQSYDCSKDEDFNQYNQLDDGYDPAAYQDFRDALSPYGQWVDNPQYGQIWVPSATEVGADFTPYYSGGRWVLSDYGWTWVSEHSWGWAPFHYGRWLQVGGYGWSWIPGRVWGPAWVHWRAGGGYVGWAPLPPRGVRIAPPGYGWRGHSWNFVASGQLTAPRLVRVAPSYLPNLYQRTTIANDYRSIGSTRIIVGPPSHFLPTLRVAPTPLGTLGHAMPRAQVVVRPGIPLQQRPYFGPHIRPGVSPGPGYQRPGFPGTAPGYQRPGYPTPVPGYQRPGFPAPAPGYQRPGFPAPAPAYPHPTTSPGRPYSPPSYPSPAPYNPRPAPLYNRPSYQPAPSYTPPAYHPAPAPSYHPAPAPAYQPAPAPTYHPAPAPAYRPAPAYHPAPAPAPTYHPAPAPTYHPAPAPAYRPAPAYHPAPAPSYHPAPSAPGHGRR